MGGGDGFPDLIVRLSFLIMAAVALTISATAAGQASGQATPTLGIDVNSDGNSASVLGAVQDCRTLNAGDTIDIDVFVKDVEELSGFQFALVYNSDVVHLTDSNDQLFLTTLEGSNLVSLSDPTPDSDGVYTAAATEFGEIGATDESGEGALMRFTLEAVGAGESLLSLFEVILTTTSPDGSSVPISPSDPDSSFFLGPVLNAALAVDEPCQPPPSSPLGAGAMPVPSSEGAVTPGEGATGEGTPAAPTDGSPTASPQPSESDLGTPEPDGTPISEAATPTPAQTAGGGADGDEDSGLSTAAWIGIGAGLGIAALAAIGTGIWLARRRARPSDSA